MRAIICVTVMAPAALAMCLGRRCYVKHLTFDLDKLE
jgi:hypothetical protein